MNKQIAIILGVLAVIIIAGVAYLMMKNAQHSQMVSVTTQNKPTSPASPTTQTIQGTLKSLLSAGKSQKCTYSNKIQTGSVNGIVYIANGKVRGDFTSSTVQNKVSGHMIVEGGYSYVWTDLSNQGVKMAINQQQPSTTPTNNQAPNINQTFTYSCQGLTEDDSMFVLPSAISFSTFAMPTSGLPASAGTSQSFSCSACNSVPAGSARDACRAQLHC